MRIAIDFFKQIKGNGKSIGIYNVSYNILKSISKIYNKKYKNLEIFVFCNLYNSIYLKDLDLNLVVIKELNPNKRFDCVLWELFFVNKYLKKYCIDNVFFPRGYRPLFCKISNSVLIHDMIPFYYDEHFPNVFNKFENFYIMNRLKSSIEHANKVITISKASKNDIIKYCNIDEKKISIIYNGIEHIDSDKFNFNKESYITAITSKFPHKNLIGILKSFEKYIEICDNPIELKLIGINTEYLNNFVKDSNINRSLINKIDCVEYVHSNNELYTIIGKSKVFLFLSLIEGFGLPPIEAMAVKTPVICSNVSSLPEVTGDACIAVNPLDYKNIAISINNVVNDNDLSTELINKGLENVKRFNWDIQGEMYLDELYRMMYNRN